MRQKENRKGYKKSSKKGENLMVNRNLDGRSREKVSWQDQQFCQNRIFESSTGPLRKIIDGENRVKKFGFFNGRSVRWGRGY